MNDNQEIVNNMAKSVQGLGKKFRATIPSKGKPRLPEKNTGQGCRRLMNRMLSNPTTARRTAFKKALANLKKKKPEEARIIETIMLKIKLGKK